MRRLCVVLVVAVLGTIRPIGAEARTIVTSTSMSFTWSYNPLIMSAIADDGTLWGLTPAETSTEWDMLDPNLMVALPNNTSWVQLPPLPEEKVPMAVQNINSSTQYWVNIYTLCLDSEGTMWGLVPKIDDPDYPWWCTYRGYRFYPEWRRLTPPLPQPTPPVTDASPGDVSDSGTDLVCD